MQNLVLTAETIPSKEEEPKAGDAFTTWYDDPNARLPHNLNRVQIHGVGLKMRAKTTQLFWKLGEYVEHVEKVMREEAYQVLDSIGYEPEYLQKIRRWYVACLSMKRKDLPISAYRALSAKELRDDDRDFLAEKYDGLTRDGFEKVVREYMVVNGTKAPTKEPLPNVSPDSKKTTKPDEVDDLIAKGEALLVAMPKEEREEAITAFLESKKSDTQEQSESSESEYPKTQCPKCGEWIEDMDGFGVLAHKACGYCSHPSQDGDGEGDFICGICGQKVGGGVGDADNPPERDLPYEAVSISSGGRAMEWKKPLWDGIHDFTRACGGDPDKHPIGVNGYDRIESVNAVERSVELSMTLAIGLATGEMESEIKSLRGEVDRLKSVIASWADNGVELSENYIQEVDVRVKANSKKFPNVTRQEYVEAALDSFWRKR